MSEYFDLMCFNIFGYFSLDIIPLIIILFYFKLILFIKKNTYIKV
jgi:hypothetical protein